jgi:ATP-dependent Clp protease adaptor protein ClpS
MSGTDIADPVKATKPKPKLERPKMYKVVLLNDDFTPREFVTEVLRAVFGMGPERAYGVMLTAHQKGVSVVAVYTRDIAETKADTATDLGRQAGFPLRFTTEPEE